MLRRTCLTFSVLALSIPASASAQGAPSFDLIIRGGRVLDGTGNPSFRADIGVRDGHIAEVGLLANATATRPLSVTMAERIEAMRAWARGRVVRAN